MDTFLSRENQWYPGPTGFVKSRNWHGLGIRSTYLYNIVVKWTSLTTNLLNSNVGIYDVV